MPLPKTLNPYPLIGQQVALGLNTIISSLPQVPTIDNLVNSVYAFIQPIYYPNATTQVETEVKSVAYNAINSYMNNLVLSENAYYNKLQAPFVFMMIGPLMTANLPPDSFIDRMADIEDNIGTSRISVEDQAPLFLATIIGSSANSYWVSQVSNPNSPWINHFSQNSGQNYLNTLQWSVAATNGALSAYGATFSGLVAPTTDVVSTNMISALIGGLTVSAAKVLFNIIPKITKTFGNTPDVQYGVKDTSGGDTTKCSRVKNPPPKCDSHNSMCPSDYTHWDMCIKDW